MPARQRWISCDGVSKLAIKFLDVTTDLVQTLFVLTLEERDGQVFCLILKRDFVADQTVPGANQLCQPGLLRRACRANGRLQGRGHASQDFRIDFICFSQNPNGLREPACTSRIQLYAWQVG